MPRKLLLSTIKESQVADTVCPFSCCCWLLLASNFIVSNRHFSQKIVGFIIIIMSMIMLLMMMMLTMVMTKSSWPDGCVQQLCQVCGRHPATHTPFDPQENNRTFQWNIRNKKRRNICLMLTSFLYTKYLAPQLILKANHLPFYESLSSHHCSSAVAKVNSQSLEDA